MNNNYSILVNSCDAYSDAWPMFFFLLKKNWDGVLPRLYLNTETKKCNITDIEVTSLNLLHPDKKIAWGARLIDCLERIESDYILLMLEDFYYESPIRVDVVNKCVRLLEENKNIIGFQFVPAGECFDSTYQSEEIFPGMKLRKKKGEYTIIAGPTLWRKSDLIRLTLRGDSPWDWETFGSRRTWFYGKKIYCWSRQDTEPIFDYDIPHGGAIHRGKWVGYKMEELQKKYDYKLNYGNIPVENDWMKSGNNKVVSADYFITRLPSIIRNRFKSLVSPMIGWFLSK